MTTRIGEILTSAVEQINVSTQFGNAVFVHSKNKLLSMRGPTEAINQWNDAYTNVLYGTFGHIFYANNCLLGDLCTALRSVFGRNSVNLSNEQKQIIQAEANSIPADAIP